MVERRAASRGHEVEETDAAARSTAKYVSQMANELAKLAMSAGFSRSSALLVLAANEVDRRLTETSRARSC
jgi:hypothetical protein